MSKFNFDAVARELSRWTPWDVAFVAGVTSPIWLPRLLHLLGVC